MYGMWRSMQLQFKHFITEAGRQIQKVSQSRNLEGDWVIYKQRYPRYLKYTHQETEEGQ